MPRRNSAEEFEPTPRPVRRHDARRSTAMDEVVKARERLPEVRKAIMDDPEKYGVNPDEVTPPDPADTRGGRLDASVVKSFRVAERERLAARRVEAMSLKMAGLDWDQIAARLQTTRRNAQRLVEDTIARAVATGVEAMREVENARLDRMQAGIWSQAIQGDIPSINAVLRIQDRRARMNGLDAPTKIDLNVGIRHEMESALDELRLTLLGDTYTVEDAQVVSGDEDEDPDDPDAPYRFADPDEGDIYEDLDFADDTSASDDYPQAAAS